MKSAVVYIHGKGGSAAESGHYRPLFPDCDVIGLDYRASVPWEAGKEIHHTIIKLKIAEILPFSADLDYSCHPRMAQENVSENELKKQGIIPASFGEDLSWEYLCYVREHPAEWNTPTAILYGRNDALTSNEAIAAFAEKHRASLTVMENGEHWFHTEEQLIFLDKWIKEISK